MRKCTSRLGFNDYTEENGVITIILTKGKTTLIDAADLPKVNHLRWHASEQAKDKFYAKTQSQAKNIFLHRFLTDCPQGLYVDHINGDSLDNRRENLRIVTQSQNIANSKPTAGKGYKGVRFDKRYGTFRATITVNRKVQNLGSFKTEAEAVAAYNEASKKFFGLA